MGQKNLKNHLHFHAAANIIKALKWCKVVESVEIAHGVAAPRRADPTRCAGKGAAAMTGEYQHTLDAKGRLFIPARLREELGDTFYLTVSDERCLRAYNAEGWQSFVDRIRMMPYVDRKKMRPFFACAAKCELDAQGRALLPQMLRDFAGLTKGVTVVGCDDHAELWDSAAWTEVRGGEISPEYIAAMMKELNF